MQQSNWLNIFAHSSLVFSLNFYSNSLCNSGQPDKSIYLEIISSYSSLEKPIPFKNDAKNLGSMQPTAIYYPHLHS